ncbi:hypothetical protein SVAN01_05510 [Stagonosporopsis vannaccii]|nr:hypothetical protein SVAN01_05510 [Stagonosporopsis vannaccii]
MNGQHIPGFYFDKEKGKYFKIQSQSQARGLNLKYSTSNLVKERRKESVQRAATAKSKRLQKERVVRRHAHSFIQSDLDREIGFKRRSVYLHSIWPAACISGLSSAPNPVTSSDDAGVVRFFDRDPVSKTIYAVCGENTIQRRHHLGDDQAANLRNPAARRRLRALDTRDRYGYYPWDELGRTTSPVSSLQYMPSSGALAVTTIGSDRPPVVLMSDPERDGPHIYQKFTPKTCAAIFCSAARPTPQTSPHHPNTVSGSDTELLAVGAQESLLLFSRSEAGTWDSNTLHTSLAADILALSWLSPNTLAAGCRNGKIHLFDLRSGRANHALTHPYAISGLARADDATRLICSGLQDTLFLYDIRMPRLSSRHNPNAPKSVKHRDTSLNTSTHYNAAYFSSLYPGNPSHGKRKQLQRRAWAKWSQPVLAFPHSNVDDLDLGLAVNERLGLVAAAQGGEGGAKGCVRVSNLWTGRVVREFEAARGPAGGKVRGLKWMHDEGDVRLWASWGAGISEFKW